MRIHLGYSPCPNDTFLFHALAHGLVSVPGIEFRERLEDVETLNRAALAGEAEVTKVSYGALPYLLDRYALLRSGGALGRGCGPLLVARQPLDARALGKARIAIPGRYTTAYLLLRLYAPGLPEGVEMVYSDIMPAVARGEVDAGLIIHESRFTYEREGLLQVVDLGEWWEGETGAPIPLGGIVARRTLGDELIGRIQDAIRRSVEAAFERPERTDAYVRRHAQEMEPEVARRHIELYVNDFSRDLGAEGEKAVDELLRRAAELTPPAPAAPPSSAP